MTIPAGTRVAVCFKNLPPEAQGVALEGPRTSPNGRTIYKVALEDHDNWVPVEWISVVGNGAS